MQISSVKFGDVLQSGLKSLPQFTCKSPKWRKQITNEYIVFILKTMKTSNITSLVGNGECSHPVSNLTAKQSSENILLLFTEYHVVCKGQNWVY